MEQPIESSPFPPDMLAYHTAADEVPADWTNVSAHGLLPESMQQEWQRLMMRVFLITFPLSLVAPGVLLWLDRGDRTALITLSVVFPVVVAGTVVIRLFRVRRQLRRYWPTFRVVMADQGIMRTRRDLPVLTIRNEEIRKLKEAGNGIFIHGARNVDIMFIPRYIEGYEAIRQRLAAIRPLARGGQKWPVARSLVVTTLVLAGFYWGWLTDDPMIRWIMFIALTALGTWSLVQRLRSPNITFRQKMLAPVALLLPAYLLLRIMMPLIMRLLSR